MTRRTIDARKRGLSLALLLPLVLACESGFSRRNPFDPAAEITIEISVSRDTLNYAGDTASLAVTVRPSRDPRYEYEFVRSPPFVTVEPPGTIRATAAGWQPATVTFIVQYGRLFATRLITVRQLAVAMRIPCPLAPVALCTDTLSVGDSIALYGFPVDSGGTIATQRQPAPPFTVVSRDPGIVTVRGSEASTHPNAFVRAEAAGSAWVVIEALGVRDSVRVVVP